MSRAALFRAAFPILAVLCLVPPAANGQAHESSSHGGGRHAPQTTDGSGANHPAHDHGSHDAAEGRAYPAGIRPITDQDRAAAFPELEGQHTVHDQAVHYFVLLDRVEGQPGGGGTALSWNTKGWIGRDIDRFWFRTEGETEHARLHEAEVHALYGRAVAPWWDVVVGIRQDMQPGPARAWLAAGVQGLAPYWFEIEATAYLGAGGRTHLRLETEYELLLTNRLILQPVVELDVFGKADPERGIGAGLSTAEAGLRLRYEVRREVAPYVGITWGRKFFGTADLARAAGEETGGARLAAGLRVWF